MMKASPQITFRPAVEADAPALRLMYDAIIDAMDISTWHTQWSKTGYPSNADFIAFARKGELHLAFADGELAAAVVLNGSYNRGYDAVTWGVACSPHQVRYIHTLGVSVTMRRCGVASALLNHVAALARAQGCKSLRLDVINTARPAERFYRDFGFIHRATCTLDYDSVCTEFNLYELELTPARKS